MSQSLQPTGRCPQIDVMGPVPKHAGLLQLVRTVLRHSFLVKPLTRSGAKQREEGEHRLNVVDDPLNNRCATLTIREHLNLPCWLPQESLELKLAVHRQGLQIRVLGPIPEHIDLLQLIRAMLRRSFWLSLWRAQAPNNGKKVCT